MRFAQAQQHADQMDQQRQPDHPEGFEDQEQFDREDRVDNEIGIGNSTEHLRAGQRQKHDIPP